MTVPVIQDTISSATDRMNFALQGDGFAYWNVNHGTLRWRTDSSSPWQVDRECDVTWPGEARLVDSPCHPFTSGFTRRTGQ